MAEWKKVIVSGSNAHLNHVTASGDLITNRMFALLPENDTLTKLVAFDENTGKFFFKEQTQFPGLGGG
tara:strand:+ start:1000 stop:1203 length:204 start_codon:yes stop_codon:yes gene_type:complete